MSRVHAVASLCFSLGLTSATPLDASSSYVVSLHENGTEELDSAFKAVYGHFADTFDSELYDEFVGLLDKGVGQYRASGVFNAYPWSPISSLPSLVSHMWFS